MFNISNPTNKNSKKSGLWYKVVKAYVGLSHNSPWIPIVVLGLLTYGSFRLAQNLRIDTDLRVLLPKGTPSVLALQEAETRMGSTDLFTIAIQDSSAEAVGRMQTAVAESLSLWSEVVWSQYDQSRYYFESHALLYLPKDQLQDLRQRIQAMVGSGFANANPLVESLEEEAPIATLDGWPNPESLRKQGLPKDLVDALLTNINDGAANSNKTSENTKTSVNADRLEQDQAPSRPDSLKSRLMGWQESKKVWVGVVLAQLNRPSTDAIFAKGIYDRGSSMLDKMQSKSNGPKSLAKVVGAYRNFSEIDQVSSDIITASSISLLLMVILLWFFVRKIVNLVIINVPLFVAMAWATGLTYLIFQRLIILTAFILALILGLGIEYTVHLYSRWAEENRKGLNPLDAMIEAVHSTGRSLLSGAATNIFAMLSLQFGHFKGFKEFGIVVSIGITCALVTTWLVIPPLFFLFTRLAVYAQKKITNPFLLRFVNLLLPGPGKVQGGVLLPKIPFTPRLLKILAAGFIICTVALIFAPSAGFENDFANLRGKSTSTGISYGRAVGAGRNTSPSIILGTSEAQMRSVHDSLAARYGNPADSMLKSFATIQSFIPPLQNQQERLAILDSIQGDLAARAFDRVDSATNAKLNLLKKHLNPNLIEYDSLPKWSQRFLTEADGRHGSFGYLYGELQESDAIESGKFQERYGTLPSDQGAVAVASSGFIYADVVRMVKGDGIRLAIITFLFLIVITWLDMRNWRGVLITCGFILVSAFWTFKLMALLGLKLGMFNLVVLPTVLSVSVDSVIHLYHRRCELGSGKIGELYQTTGSAVLTGTLNNAFGFVGLCFVSHKGMQTIGQMATLGIGCGLLVMFLLLPWVLEILCPNAPEGSIN